MSPSNIKKARTSTMSKPVVRSATATEKLALSLRRLGADEATVAKLTGDTGPHPAAR
jgi:hypothetical protein